MNLEELLNLISSTSVDDTKLFFITRALKPVTIYFSILPAKK